MKKSSLQKFRKVLKDHALTLEHGNGGHLIIRKNGNMVASCAHTARRGCEDAIFELSRSGYVPKELRRVNF